MATARVLVADDKENILKLFEKMLSSGFELVTASDGTRALALLASEEFDVVVSDIRMPGADGMTVLSEVKRAAPNTEVILMTAFGSIERAVDAMKAGAYDYLTKPFEPEKALLLIERAVERKRLREQARSLSSLLEKTDRFEGLLGSSAAMQKTFALMRRAAAANATVLVTGDSGTGKELVARALHRAGPRKKGPFVAVNCGAIPETLVESELFGHVKGSFTGASGDKKGLFEEANGGTLLLDEVVELPLSLQVKLTRALQERTIRRVGGTKELPVDVRVIAASNLDLMAAVNGGKFREDLYYRLNIFPISLPPLRDRLDDVPALAALFLARHRSQRDQKIEGFTAEALSALLRYRWPGNVRELENAVLRALAVSDGPRIDVNSLPSEITRGVATGAAAASVVTALPYRETVDMERDRASRHYLAALMREFRGNVKQASDRAGVERESLHRLLKKHGLSSDDFRD